jgi:hypothetical protein
MQIGGKDIENLLMVLKKKLKKYIDSKRLLSMLLYLGTN